MNLKIDKTTVELSFGMILFRDLGRRWNLDSFGKVFLKLGIIETVKDDVPIDVVDVLFDVIEVSAQVKDKDVSLDYNEVVNFILTTPDIVAKIIGELIKSM